MNIKGLQCEARDRGQSLTEYEYWRLDFLNASRMTLMLSRTMGVFFNRLWVARFYAQEMQHQSKRGVTTRSANALGL